MLERVLSLRRGTPSDDDGAAGGDESKTRKHASFAIRATNYMARTGYLWPCLILALVLLVIFSVIIHTRDLVCVSSVSSFDPASRLRFLGFDGLDSDFGSLGIPWCRSKHGKTVEWTSKDLLKGLEEFVPIYETRPIKNNMYGMGFDHSFGLWFMARQLKPDLMIESGAFKGHSTWILRQAMPDTRILSITPRHPEKYLKKGPAYVDQNCTYFAGKDFVDFGSVDWVLQISVGLKQALKAGFKHLVFEDNYDTGTGDHYSLRQICDQSYLRGGGHSCFKDGDEARVRSRRRKFWEKAVDIKELCGPGEAWWGVRGYMRDDFNHSNKAITHEQHFQNSRFVESILDVYWELPPVAGPSLTHQSRYDPARVTSPIVEDGRYGLFQRLGLSRLESSVFNGYTQMVYLRISEK
ncbi:hypothetical protein RJ639_040906 [Escallonia herrerae]|uniref:Uncharacterized protein n=1 Tax=Escallonia herrerae TaxID=1293975 RepID=A0AA89B2P7_9ASTE|nr:hypothetical protein RJ639_040906 [Escallonia herrerae]